MTTTDPSCLDPHTAICIKYFLIEIEFDTDDINKDAVYTVSVMSPIPADQSMINQQLKAFKHCIHCINEQLDGMIAKLEISNIDNNNAFAMRIKQNI